MIVVHAFDFNSAFVSACSVKCDHSKVRARRKKLARNKFLLTHFCLLSSKQTAQLDLDIQSKDRVRCCAHVETARAELLVG